MQRRRVRGESSNGLSYANPAPLRNFPGFDRHAKMFYSLLAGPISSTTLGRLEEGDAGDVEQGDNHEGVDFGIGDHHAGFG
jgi:hypothetical protein